MERNLSPILELAVPVKMWQKFDYLPPVSDTQIEPLLPGIRIQVPFGKRSLMGVLLRVKNKTEVPAGRLKQVIEIIDNQPILSPGILSLSEWTSNYYHYPIGEVVSQALPKALRQGRRVPEVEQFATLSEFCAPHLNLNADQQKAVETILANDSYQTYLLDGVTGSGKTEVYFQSISKMIQTGRQILFLVPEISLTPQTQERFEKRFGARTVLLHSDLTDKHRLTGWVKAITGAASIIIGTRSAIFTPLRNPGMIILDEEHDLSFKQQNNLRYSARDLAIVRGRIENIPIILGSATPAFESLYNAKIKKYCHLKLTKRAGQSEQPKVSLINLRNKRLKAGLSTELIDTMTLHIQAGNQVLLFLNRRGYASVVMCHLCGWMVKCHYCDARLTLHLHTGRLHCHHCGASQKQPKICKQCHSSEIITVGQGTERIEHVISEYFPDQKIIRIDRDTTKSRGSMQELLAAAHDDQAQILIGTQMLAKGHHFPNLTLVAILDGDNGLFSVDFRGLERMAQLLVQVGGRAGRMDRAGEVVIQTHHPDHFHLKLLLKNGYHRFAQELLVERKEALLPPFAYLALLRGESKKREITELFLNEAKMVLQTIVNDDQINILGPIPAPMERLGGRFRGQLLLQAASRSELQAALQKWIPQVNLVKISKKVRWSVDIDPQELI